MSVWYGVAFLVILVLFWKIMKAIKKILDEKLEKKS